MSMTMATPERGQLDQGAMALAQQITLIRGNAIQFGSLVAELTASLDAPPYEYDADDKYALTVLASLGKAWAEIVGAGGTLSAQDGAALLTVAQKLAGPMIMGIPGTRSI